MDRGCGSLKAHKQVCRILWWFIIHACAYKRDNGTIREQRSAYAILQFKYEAIAHFSPSSFAALFIARFTRPLCFGPTMLWFLRTTGTGSVRPVSRNSRPFGCRFLSPLYWRPNLMDIALTCASRVAGSASINQTKA